jgi:phage FluMu gp28-like protein
MDWQRQYIEDQGRFKLLVATTQGGKSFATSLEFCLDRVRPGAANLGIMLSASERQSVELMEKVRMHTAAWKVDFDSREEKFEGIDVTQHTATFANGKRIIALPANPATARGYSGDVFLDEFALHKDARSIWAALFGRITRGFKLRVASTIHGTENKFYELVKLLGLHEGQRPGAQPVRANGWSGHWVDIFMCREQGLDVNVEQLRLALADEDVFLQEYCNQAIDSAMDFIPLNLVLSCESEEAKSGFDFEARPGLFAGFDVARKRDLSVIWIFEERGDVLVTVGVIKMLRTPFKEQFAMASKVARAVDRMGVDTTGIGAQIGEDLAAAFPEKIDQVNFAGTVETGRDEDGKPIKTRIKETLATSMKTAMESQLVLLPDGDLANRRAWQAVKRLITPTGYRLDSARTDAGHADEFWAAAIARSMAVSQVNYVPASSVGLMGKPVAAGMLGMRF